MCEYCNGNKILKGEEYQGNSYSIDNKNRRLILEYDIAVFDRLGNNIEKYVEGEDFITIDFCPKCGRRL